tara:strand:- start:43 stop:672 length:630 start_codon:yes stop_codon:yes gene_type:complete
MLLKDNDNKIINNFFSTPVSFWKCEDFVPDLKKEILSKEIKGIESNIAPLLKHNLVESDFKFLTRDHLPVIKNLNSWIYSCLKQTINTLQKEDVHYEVTIRESWYHITKTNGVHEPHIHPGCSWCGLYYVQSGDEGSGQTIFDSPLKSTYIDRGNFWLGNDSGMAIDPRDGLLVLFPSYLMHYQSLYKGSQDRIVIGFNCIVHESKGEK